MPDPDNQLRWLNTCCPDWEGGFSMNPCCPVSVSACVSEFKDAQLCGFDEFEGNGVEASSPPKRYLRNTYTFSEVRRTWDCKEAVDQNLLITSTSNIYSKVSEYDESDCTQTIDPSDLVKIGEYTPWKRDWDADQVRKECIPGITIGDQPWIRDTDRDADITDNQLWSNSSFLTVESTTEKGIVDDTESYNTGGAGDCDYCESQLSYSRQLSRTNILSNEDTESRALLRAESIQGDSCTSSFVRDKHSTSFTKTTVKHEAVVTGLVIGFCYEGVIPIEKALVQYDEDGDRLIPEEDDWLPFSLTAINYFRAEQVFQTFGQGTLNVSDDDFINANFSLDPYDYPFYFPVDPETGILIDPDALVLTPFSDLPESKVYDYRVLPAVMRRLECEET